MTRPWAVVSDKHSRAEGRVVPVKTPDQQPPPRVGISRRVLLGALAAAGGAVVLSGCSPNPVVSGDRRTTKVQRAATLPESQRDAAVIELGLAAAFTELSARAEGWAADPGTPQWCRAAATAHAAHAGVLVQADPLAGAHGDRTPLASLPAATPAPANDLTQALIQIETQLSAAIDRYRQLLADRIGAEALLFVSLQACAQALLSAVEAKLAGNGLGPALEAGAAVPVRVEVGSRAETLAVTLTHLDALVYALQTAIGRLPRRDPLAVTLETRLPQAQTERNQVAALIAGVGATPGAPQLHYELPPFGTALQMGNAIGALERNVMDGWARVAAASEVERAAALLAMNAQAAQVRARGVALSYWPGWV